MTPVQYAQNVKARFNLAKITPASMARIENAARLKGNQFGGGTWKKTVYRRTKPGPGHGSALEAKRAREAEINQERIALIIAALSEPMTVKAICGKTDIPTSSVQRILDGLRDDGKVSRVKHSRGSIWALETP